MDYWREVWERKGASSTVDLKELDGFEANNIDPREAAHNIATVLDLKKTDKVLEIGCGAGMIAEHLNCDYVGIDYSRSLINRHIRILGHSVLHCEADDLVFKDHTFDKAFAYSVFQYFPDKDYVFKALNEMKRVARETIFVGDLPIQSHRDEHLLFDLDEFQTWEISDGYYNKDRFNAVLKLTK